MSSTLGWRTFGAGLIVWFVWRLFAPLHLGWLTLYWSAVVCFVVPLSFVLLWPHVAFEIGRHAMRVYHERKGWLVMRDLPIASRAAFRRVRADQARRKRAP